MELIKKQVINTLNTFKLEWGELVGPEDNLCDALEYAISSLKTDEAYQIMYEGGEIFTKADIVAMLEELQKEIEEMQSRETWCDYATDNCICRYEVTDFIQQKINSLKAEGEDNNGDS